DLRLHDHHALDQALQAGRPVLLLFIFDRNILSQLSERRDKRVTFIHHTLSQLNKELLQHDSSLFCVYDTPLQAFQKLLEKFEVKEVFANHDYEPYAIARDKEIQDFLQGQQIAFHNYKDQVIFEKSEIMKPDGSPYTVVTPYSRLWKSNYFQVGDQNFSSAEKLSRLFKTTPFSIPALETMGFEEAPLSIPLPQLSEDILEAYQHTRNVPSISGTSQVSAYLRFGLVSIRELVRLANQNSEIWLNELIWREFFMMILFQFPQVVDQSFKPKYDRIPWRNDEEEFDSWCRGETGYPIVDAGMRQLNQTGWMHN